MEIGNWIKRGRQQKWHLVESIVAGDAFTKCGRRMDRITDEGRLRVSQQIMLTRMIGQPQNCKFCDR